MCVRESSRATGAGRTRATVAVRDATRRTGHAVAVFVRVVEQTRRIVRGRPAKTITTTTKAT